MASGTDNPRPISGGATYFIEDPLGKRQLRQVMSHNFSTEGGLTVSTGPGGVLGKTQAAGGYSGTVTVKHSRGVRDEVAWEVLRVNNIDFTFEVQFQGGQRHIYRRCGVSTISDSAGEDGQVQFEIALVAEEKEVLETAPA